MLNLSSWKPSVKCPREEESSANKGCLKDYINYCHSYMVRKYSNQREYFNVELINHVLDAPSEVNQCEVKFSPSLRVKTIDFKYDDEYEYLTKFYRNCDRIIEMAEICEYYRYYIESPILTDHDHFNIFYVHTQKKKEILYKKLQNILNCTHQSSEICSQTGKHDKMKTSLNSRQITPNYLENILKDISLSISSNYSEDQSQCFAGLRDKLISKYGFSKTKSMEDADKLYSFKKILIKKKPFSILKKQRNLKTGKGSLKIPNRKQIIQRIMLESTNNSSVQQGQSNFNISKNLLQHEFQSKNSEHSVFRRKKMCANVKEYEKSLNRYRSSCEFAKDIPAIYEAYKRQQPLLMKKKLRKRSCENIFAKKFKTLDDENYAYSPGQQKTKQNLQYPDHTNDNQLVPSKMKLKKQRSYVKSCEIKIDFKRNQGQKDYRQKITKECSPSFCRQQNKTIKQTIEMFRNKIRQQMREINSSKENQNQNKQTNMVRMHTTPGPEKAQKATMREKKKNDRSTENNKPKKIEGPKNASKFRQACRK